MNKWMLYLRTLLPSRSLFLHLLTWGDDAERSLCPGARHEPAAPTSSARTPGANYPPGVGSGGPSAVAGDEGGVVLGALEAVQLGSPEGGLGWAGGRHMQPLLHLDAEEDTGAVRPVGAKLWTGSGGKTRG